MDKSEVMSKLKNKIRKATSNVSMKVEAEKGDYKVILTASNIVHMYKNQEVGKIRVADLDDEVINLINSEPNEVAQEMLDEFVTSFDTESMKTAAADDKTVKTAANDAIDESTWQKVTQKQLDEDVVKLHPRQNEHYNNVTQKQLPEHGQRPGTYDVTTEAQFRDETTTFYGAPRTAGEWKGEDRNTVTEAQFEEGVKEYSDVGRSDRNEIGSKYDGGLDKQWKMTGEKQLMELLKHHEWTEPFTTTEGKDQLGKQDGELARITAEIADKIIKESLNALGNTILAVGITPDDLSGIVKQLVSHKSKYPVLADTIKQYTNSDIQSITKKVAKAKHFGKTANTNADWSPYLAADVLVRQLAKSSHNPRFIVNSLVALADNKDLSDKITQATNDIMNNKVEATAKEDDDVSVFKQVLAAECHQEGDANDGMYAYRGVLSEVNADPNDQDKFSKAAAEVGKNQIQIKVGKKLNLIADVCDVNTATNEFEVIFRDADHKVEVADKSLEARAAKRREMAKTAQMGGAGGAPPAGGPEMSNPMTPPTGGDTNPGGGAPPGEALSQEAPVEEEKATGEPSPPGTKCLVCGGEDVDTENGEWRCNSCGSKGEWQFQATVKEGPGFIENKSKGEEKGGFGLEDGGMGATEEGMAADNANEDMTTGVGSGTTLPNIPVGASYRITPLMLQKLAKEKIQIGTVCPNCGSKNTDVIKSASLKGHDGICWDCYQEFNFRVKASKSKKNNVYAQTIWVAKLGENPECSSCSRSNLRTAFVKSLEDYGSNWKEFDGIKSMKGKADFIVAMAKSGSLNIRQAMESPLPVKKYAASNQWKGYDKFDKFPSASCMEKLSRRFGENATAMSGPCEGKSLARCVCAQLETLGIYTDGLAAKVASRQSSQNPMENNPTKTCVAMLVREGMEVDEACTACDGLRAAYADTEELIIESIAQINPNLAPKPMSSMNPSPKPMRPSPKPMGMSPQPDTGSKPMPGMGGGMDGSGGGMMPKPVEDVGSPMDNMGDGMEVSIGLDGGMGSGMDSGMHDHGMGHDMNSDMGGMDDMGSDGMGSDGEMGGMFDDNLDMGFESGDEVTLQLPQNLATALEETLSILQNALQGNIGNDLIDSTGDGMGSEGLGDGLGDGMDGSDGLGGSDDGSIAEISADSPMDGEAGSEKSEGHSHESSDEIPGLSDEGKDDEMVKESNPEKESHESHSEGHSEKSDKKEKPMMANASTEKKTVEAKSASNSEPEQKIVTASNQSSDDLQRLLFSMKKGSIKRKEDAVNSVFDGILRQAHLAALAAKEKDVKKVEYKSEDSGSKLKATPAQDTDGIGKVSDGGKIQHEKPFSEGVNKKPDVPRSAATMGDEGSEMTISESGDLPTVPHGSKPMKGEEHHKPEKGNVVDGNQGGKKASTQPAAKTASGGCRCGTKGCNCKGCKSEKCGKPCPCSASSGKTYKVAFNHKYYNAFLKRLNAGTKSIKLEDGNTYSMNMDDNKSIVLAQTVSPKKQEDGLADDPDINQSSGPGKGKTHVDKAHSLGVDEKKPSEGMDKPDVPEAPDGGRLKNEHTVEKSENGPEIPAGGGMHSEYDKNEKNKPEKLDETIGLMPQTSLAERRNDAIKVAGQMLKAHLIAVDDLSKKIEELSQLSPNVLKDYETMLQKTASNEDKGMKKEANSKSVEQLVVPSTLNPNQSPLVEGDDLAKKVQSLFRLDKQNKDHEKWTQTYN